MHGVLYGQKLRIDMGVFAQQRKIGGDGQNAQVTGISCAATCTVP